jgi:hypothetical protein
MSLHSKVIAEVTLLCNRCQGETVNVFTIRRHRPEELAELTHEFVRKQAASVGWTRGCESQDLCPKCSERPPC